MHPVCVDRRYITLHYITLHYILLHYVTLRYITLHFVTLRYITLRHIKLLMVTTGPNCSTPGGPRPWLLKGVAAPTRSALV